MQYDATIRVKVEEFIRAEKLFTSVDIANSIKMDGIWVRNTEVRHWLQNNFNDKLLFGDYVLTPIHVCSGSSLASLYHPALSDPNSYLDRDQRSLTPDDVKAIQKSKVGTPNPVNAPDIHDILSTDDDEDDAAPTMSIVIRSTERIKIPGLMIRELGWAPGQNIDPALILTDSVLPPTLTVNNDYRVSIPRTAVKWGTNPVKVILKDGKIHFEKA
jgi:hypothetical protein